MTLRSTLHANVAARRASRAASALLLAALAGACSREPAAPAPAGTAATQSGAATAPDTTGVQGGAGSAGRATAPRPEESTLVIPDGSPRIVDSSAGGVHVQYRVHGHGEPLVVLIHGWSCDSNYWQAQVADLKTRYTVATVDLAGHGASGANRDDWSMAAFGADVAAVVDALPDHPRVVLVGHS
ncbi:MAG: alpha/beta fold hydrolase, partial [Rubrivivax sp.]